MCSAIPSQQLRKLPRPLCHPQPPSHERKEPRVKGKGSLLLSSGKMEGSHSLQNPLGPMTAFPTGSRLGSVSRRDLTFQDGRDGGLWWLETVSRGRAGQIPSSMCAGGRRRLPALGAGVSGRPRQTRRALGGQGIRSPLPDKVSPWGPGHQVAPARGGEPLGAGASGRPCQTRRAPGRQTGPEGSHPLCGDTGPEKPSCCGLASPVAATAAESAVSEKVRFQSLHPPLARQAGRARGEGVSQPPRPLRRK